MLGYLSQLTTWTLVLMVIGGFVLGSLGSYFLFHRIVRSEIGPDDRSTGMTVVGVIATITSLLLAFSAVSVWDSFGTAEKIVVLESDTLAVLARDLAVFGTPEARDARERVRDYGRVVLDQEGAAMQQGTVRTSDSRDAVDDIFRAVARLDPDTPAKQALLPEIWKKTNELAQYRRERIFASQSDMPSTLWIVVIVGTMLTLALMFPLPPTRFNVVLIFASSLAFALVFSFILAMNHPFGGVEKVSLAPIESALDAMRTWDAREARPPK